MKYKNIIGNKYSKLTVIEFALKIMKHLNESCAKWKNNFIAFYKWTTWSEQANNRRGGDDL